MRVSVSRDGPRMYEDMQRTVDLAALADTFGYSVQPPDTDEYRTIEEIAERHGCMALLVVYLDAVAAEVIAEQEQRAHEAAVARWEGEGGR